MPLPDPRQYPSENTRNPLINLALSVEQHSSQDHAVSQFQALTTLVASMLANHENAALNAAFVQASSAENWQILADAMDAATCTSEIFTIPVIIVASGNQEATLSTVIDPHNITEILRQNGALPVDAAATIYPRLLSLETLTAINPSDVFEWQQEHQTTPRALQSIHPDSDSIEIKEESAWLRFLLGHITPSNPELMLGKASMPLSQALGKSLQQGELSVLALPHSIHLNWFGGLAAGRRALLETRLQLLVSNAVRAIRSKKRTPVGTIAAHEGDEIRVALSSQEDSERWYGFVWPLNPGDNIEDICRFIKDLLHDCQIGDIRIIDSIQPDLENDIPFFVTAHFPPQRYTQ